MASSDEGRLKRAFVLNLGNADYALIAYCDSNKAAAAMAVVLCRMWRVLMGEG